MIESLTKDNAANSAAAFQRLISGPLQTVLGQSLLAVNYWLLDYDKADFSLEQPNETGVLTVCLHFERAAIEISPGWDNQLRSEGIYHHVQVVQAAKAGSLEAAHRENLSETADVHAASWQEALGKRLTGVEIAGFQGTPQAVRLSFSVAEVVVATGYAGSDLLIGDGDELLIFSGQEWHNQNQNSVHKQAWERLWAASAAAYEEMLVK